jgi:7-carboxy-7-deazaguanine synthase
VLVHETKPEIYNAQLAQQKKVVMPNVVTKIPATIKRAAEVTKTGATSALTATVAREEQLRINEIFFSLQGESSRVGLPTVFVRLTGCPLRCGYCDTEYAFHDGKTRSIDAVVADVAAYLPNPDGPRSVCVTGGEPLAQKNCLILLKRLCDAGFSVSLETSGAIDVAGVDARVSRIMDIKTPGSNEVEKNFWKNLEVLTAHDEIKFVITSRADFDWAVAQLRERALAKICPVLFSPSFHDLSAADLAQWVLASGLPVRMQLQLHKVLWGETKGK